MQKIPTDLHYSKEHEWARVEGEVVEIGITDHAQSQLGDVVYVELPEVGKKIEKERVFGVVESVKAVSDLFAPVSGEVLEVNQDLVGRPEAINESPYDKAWLIKVKASSSDDITALMNAAQYENYLNELSK